MKMCFVLKNTLEKVVFTAVLFSCSELSAVVCEMPDSSFLDLGEFIGANAFYERGVYGQGVNVANIELEVASKEDEESYGKYAVFLKDSVYTTYVPNYEIPSFHAYATLAIMAGNNKSYKDQKAATGLANMANYVSGQLKDGIRASNKDAVKVYETFFSNGTDVISSSWKDSGDSSYMAGVVLDSYAAKGVNTVFVAAAANDGESGAGSVCSPYRNMNVISVGALDDATGFKTVADTSSYGPNDFYNPVNGTTVKGVVSAVDIAAAGTVYTVNRSGVLENGRGTSFAAPMVSSAAALMLSYSKRTSMAQESRDARLVKAVLLNSADKTEGWDNGSILADGVSANGNTFDGVLTTSQALDYKSGAGALNAAEALSQYDGFGTTSFLGNVGSGESYFYEFYADESGAVLGATLCWMLGSTVNDIAYDSFEEITSIDASSSYFANLDLRLWYEDGSEDILIAQSVSEYNNVEHLFLELTKVGNYKLEVFFKDLVYGNSASETYGIAWNLASIPEPSEYAAVIGITAILIAAFRRKKQ